MTVVHRVEGVGPRVALTFDDCDSSLAWSGIIDALHERAVPATFFALGIRVSEHPDLAARTVVDGHAIGSHGHDHARLTRLTSEGIRRRLALDEEVWRQAAGASPRPWLRPPYGDFDDHVAGVAADAGFDRLVLWDVDPLDWQAPGRDAVAARVLGGVRRGSIVLLHAVRDTAAALPSILDGLSDAGLEPVTIPSLLEPVE